MRRLTIKEQVKIKVLKVTNKKVLLHSVENYATLVLNNEACYFPIFTYKFFVVELNDQC